MALSSMTGFGRADGAAEGLAWTWEIRSVNGRGLDIRMRFAPGYDSLDVPVREALAKRLVRGNVSVSLTVERRGANGSVRLNEALLGDILKAADRVAELSGGARPSTADLLTMKGVLENVESGLDDPQQCAARERALLASLDEAAGKLVDARRAEGARIAAVLSDQVAQIESLAAEVRASPSRTPQAIRARLAEVVSRLLDTSANFDAERLHQEAVIAATRADVEEELARLNAHVAAAREIMSEPGAVGRKLDFLAQEFNREANTLCSKANAVDITRLGLSLKSVIDQLREQVQNVE
ncbi:MAG TPA: YicC family protein [Hyphomicrobium sp.]|nr:YicC family protein [Hyphomicrobium sp.]